MLIRETKKGIFVYKYHPWFLTLFWLAAALVVVVISISARADLTATVIGIAICTVAALPLYKRIEFEFDQVRERITWCIKKIFQIRSIRFFKCRASYS